MEESAQILEVETFIPLMLQVLGCHVSDSTAQHIASTVELYTCIYFQGTFPEVQYHSQQRGE